MKGVISILVAVGLIVAITLLLHGMDKPAASRQYAAVKASPEQPDIRIRRVRLLKTDEFGYHKFHLHADEVKHFLRKSTELERLRLLVTSSEASDWIITAESGWMDAEDKQILLQGEVLVHQEQEDGNDVTGITRDMIVDYPNSLAYSTAAATLLSGENMTSGTGMAIKFSTPSRIRLLSRVTATHDFD
ncbi:MAG: LPS export ABC transporter periplasmic protein LptC [Gammaproteobacteria bacterium]|jgi:LPS export ABC transporter protein LptC